MRRRCFISIVDKLLMASVDEGKGGAGLKVSEDKSGDAALRGGVALGTGD